MSVTLFRRRASDHVDGGHLAAYRGMLGPHLERIELVCDSVGDIAEDLRRKSRDPDQVAEKLIHHSEALGGVSRVTFQMNAASLPHEKLMSAIELIGTRVAPAVRDRLGALER